MATASSDTQNTESECIFCDLGLKSVKTNTSPSTDYETDANKYFYVDDEMFVVADIKPHTENHFLVIPKTHIESAKILTENHIPLIKRMVKIGLEVLKKKRGSDDIDTDELRMGFHWPPFTLVKHLHLHIMYPVSGISFIAKQMLFRPGLIFVTPEWVIERIQKISQK